MSVIKNQRGSILLVVFTVSVVVAVLMTSMYFLMLDSALRQSRRGDGEAYAAMLYSLKAQVEDPSQCPKIFQGVSVPSSFRGKVNNLKLPWVYGNDPNRPKDYKNPPEIQKGWKIPKTRLTVKDVILLRSGGNAGTVNIKTGKNLVEYKTVPLRLYIELEEFGLNMADEDPSRADPEAPELLTPMVRRDLMIRFLANVDSSGKIYNCFGFESSAAACQALGAAYNHRGPALFKCQPDKQCFAGKQGLVSDKSDCKTGMPVPYKSLEMGLVDGKKVYTCTLCREDL